MTAAQLWDTLQRLGWTQKRLAEELNVSLRTINGWANGKPIPMIAALAIYYLENHERFDR